MFYKPVIDVVTGAKFFMETKTRRVIKVAIRSFVKGFIVI